MQALCQSAYNEQLARKLSMVLAAMDSARECKDKQVYLNLYRTKKKLVALLN